MFPVPPHAILKGRTERKERKKGVRPKEEHEKNEPLSRTKEDTRKKQETGIPV